MSSVSDPLIWLFYGDKRGGSSGKLTDITCGAACHMVVSGFRKSPAFARGAKTSGSPPWLLQPRRCSSGAVLSAVRSSPGKVPARVVKPDELRWEAIHSNATSRSPAGPYNLIRSALSPLPSNRT